MTSLHPEHFYDCVELEFCPDAIEQRLIRAYVQLVFAPRADDRRTVTLGWIGTYEVRLTELEPEAACVGFPPFWLEIYCHAMKATIDSCGCFEFDDCEIAVAVETVLRNGGSTAPLH